MKQTEQRRARELKGQRQPGSGSGRRKGDIRTSDTIEEIKQTTKKSFSIKLDDWLKLAKYASKEGKEPSMLIIFENAGIRLCIRQC